MKQTQKDQLLYYVYTILTEGMNDELKMMKKSEWFWEGVKDIIPNNNPEEVIRFIERFNWDIHIEIPSPVKEHTHW